MKVLESLKCAVSLSAFFFCLLFEPRPLRVIKLGLALDSLLTASLLFNGMYSRDKSLTK